MKRALKKRYGRSSASGLNSLLSSVERTVDNTGGWSGEWGGAKIWIGDKSGSRVGQYEARVLKDGVAVDVRSRTFSGLKKQIVKAVASL